MIGKAAWTIVIGVLSVVVATLIFRLVRGQGAVFVLILVWCVGLVAGLAAWVGEISPPTGAAGGVLAAVIVVTVLAVTISAAPLAPGATRPGLRDLFWAPLLGLVVVLGLCAVAGWYGVRAGLVLARRRKIRGHHT
jgi:hypothetical protein